MAATKLSLYNDTLILLGERTLLTDTDDVPPRYDLDALYDNGAVDYCLEIVKPRYASIVKIVVGIAAQADTTFAWQVDLPDADFLALAKDAQGRPAVYLDGKYEQPVTRFVQEADYLLSDFQTLYIRYIVKHAASFLPIMPSSFGRVVSAYMARELAWKFDPDSEEHLQETLEKRIEVSMEVEINNEPQERGFTPIVLTNEYRHIFNDALMLLKLDPIATNNDDSVRKNRLSLTLDAQLVEAVLEDSSWQFGLQSDQIFYDPAIDPAWGYKFVFEEPTGMHRLNGIYNDEFMRSPIRDYIHEDNKFFCSYQTIYIEYVSKDFLTTPQSWPAYFRRLVAARMAIDANIPGSDIQNAAIQYENRRKEAKSTDAMSGPPKTLSAGSWAKTRVGYRGSNRDRP